MLESYSALSKKANENGLRNYDKEGLSMEERISCLRLLDLLLIRFPIVFMYSGGLGYLCSLVSVSTLAGSG